MQKRMGVGREGTGANLVEYAKVPQVVTAGKPRMGAELAQTLDAGRGVVVPEQLEAVFSQSVWNGRPRFWQKMFGDRRKGRARDGHKLPEVSGKDYVHSSERACLFVGADFSAVVVPNQFSQP